MGESMPCSSLRREGIYALIPTTRDKWRWDGVMVQKDILIWFMIENSTEKPKKEPLWGMDKYGTWAELGCSWRENWFGGAGEGRGGGTRVVGL
jgi:hypothetical protein